MSSTGPKAPSQSPIFLSPERHSPQTPLSPQGGGAAADPYVPAYRAEHAQALLSMRSPDGSTATGTTAGIPPARTCAFCGGATKRVKGKGWVKGGVRCVTKACQSHSMCADHQDFLANECVPCRVAEAWQRETQSSSTGKIAGEKRAVSYDGRGWEPKQNADGTFSVRLKTNGAGQLKAHLGSFRNRVDARKMRDLGLCMLMPCDAVASERLTGNLEPAVVESKESCKTELRRLAQATVSGRETGASQRHKYPREWQVVECDSADSLATKYVARRDVRVQATKWAIYARATPGLRVAVGADDENDRLGQKLCSCTDGGQAQLIIDAVYDFLESECLSEPGDALPQECIPILKEYHENLSRYRRHNILHSPAALRLSSEWQRMQRDQQVKFEADTSSGGRPVWDPCARTNFLHGRRPKDRDKRAAVALSALTTPPPPTLAIKYEIITQNQIDEAAEQARPARKERGGKSKGKGEDQREGNSAEIASDAGAGHSTQGEAAPRSSKKGKAAPRSSNKGKKRADVSSSSSGQEDGEEEWQGRDSSGSDILEESSSASDDEVPYEQERKANIARNQAVLASMGIAPLPLPAVGGSTASAGRASRKPKRPRDESGAPAVPERRAPLREKW